MYRGICGRSSKASKASTTLVEVNVRQEALCQYPLRWTHSDAEAGVQNAAITRCTTFLVVTSSTETSPPPKELESLSYLSEMALEPVGFVLVLLTRI